MGHQFINSSLACYSACVKWATTKPLKIIRQPGLTMTYQRTEREREEKEWGNLQIGQVGNGQWTTRLGEQLVHDTLAVRGENPRKPQKRGGFLPDWETDKYIYEVKTSNWNVSGTAGEKVLGTWIKYQNIPDLYDKPLRIVCVAQQEEELTTGKVQYFGPGVTGKTKTVLLLARHWGIEYVRFSDLLRDSAPDIINGGALSD